LIIQALSEEKISIDNLSNSDDSRIIQEALTGIDMIIDCNQSGAALRFLCAFFSNQQNREIILTGSQRLKERPLKILVDVLKELGADIEYLEKTGFAPIKIKGKELISHAPITIQADVSSQFISALLMIGPKVKNGLQLHLENKIISAPYLSMTMQMMHEAKVHIILNDQSIIIPEQEYEQCNFYIEPDWSAASYWYAMVSLGVEEIYLPGFKSKSTQGDAILAEWMRDWNVETTFEKEGIRLKHTEHFVPVDLYDFVNCPDIAQTMITLSALRKHAMKFTGIESLAHKETNRIEALQNELNKLGVEMLILDSGRWTLDAKHGTLDTGQWTQDNGLTIETYHDHRMAMAFSMLAMVVPEVTIEHPEVVSKSYPNFWKDMDKLGFSMSSG
jgi:3-phosphoshikimate 1-carboxyvinyltransferase